MNVFCATLKFVLLWLNRKLEKYITCEMGSLLPNYDACPNFYEIMTILGSASALYENVIGYTRLVIRNTGCFCFLPAKLLRGLIRK